jgi:hypothetical protein
MARCRAQFRQEGHDVFDRIEHMAADNDI